MPSLMNVRLVVLIVPFTMPLWDLVVFRTFGSIVSFYPMRQGRYFTSLTAGIFHVPSMIDGLFSFGQ